MPVNWCFNYDFAYLKAQKYLLSVTALSQYLLTFSGLPPIMNAHLYDIKNIPRPDYFLTFSQINVILNISKSQNTKKIKAKNTYLLEIYFLIFGLYSNGVKI